MSLHYYHYINRAGSDLLSPGFQSGSKAGRFNPKSGSKPPTTSIFEDRHSTAAGIITYLLYIYIYFHMLNKVDSPISLHMCRF